MVHRTLLIFLFSCIVPTIAAAQADGLAELNALFGGSAVFKLDKRQQLVIDLYDASGRFRQDVVPVTSIDPEQIYFSLEEDAVILGCRAGHDRCFAKELFKLNTVRLTGRCNLPRPPHDDGGLATMDAIRAWLATQAATAAETPLRNERKN
ncbi:MAG: hypothetical protein WAT74_10175 [Flavobacteriales bacterium]